MSEKIGRNRANLPWNDSELDAVRNVRSAVTERAEGQRLDHEVAPMMGEFLATLDELVGPDAVDDFPAPPVKGESPSPRQAFAALHSALASVEQIVEARPEEQARLQPMIDVLRRYTTMKDEVIHRVDGERNA